MATSGTSADKAAALARGLEGVIGFQSVRSDFLISGAEAFMPP